MEILENFLQKLDIEHDTAKSKILNELKEIINQLECKKEFDCIRSGERQCSAKNIEIKGYIECDPDTCNIEHPAFCKSGISYGYSYMCNCPMRVYLCKVLKR